MAFYSLNLNLCPCFKRLFLKIISKNQIFFSNEDDHSRPSLHAGDILGFDGCGQF